MTLLLVFGHRFERERERERERKKKLPQFGDKSETPARRKGGF